MKFSPNMNIEYIHNQNVSTLKGPAGHLFGQVLPKSASQAPFGGSICWSIKVQEGPLDHIIVPGYPKSCSYQNTYLAKDDYSAQKVGVTPFPKPVSHFFPP